VVEEVEGNRVVGRIVVDFVGSVVGIIVDNMVVAFVAGSFAFVELGWVVEYWQQAGRLGTLVEIPHGPPCRPPVLSSLGNCFQTF